MLKRTVAGFVCILLAFGGGLAGETYLRHTAREMLLAVETALAAENDGVCSLARDAADTWANSKKLLSAIVKHSDADALDKLYTQLSDCAAAGDAERTRALLLTCRAEVLTLLDGERTAWYNILQIEC